MQNLTESRIKRILELQPELRRIAKKDANKFLDVPHLPDIGKGETLEEVVAPQMSKYFAGLSEDPVEFFKDRSRMLMIFHAVKAGGIRILIEKYRQLTSGEFFRSVITDMEEKGFGNPAAAEQIVPQAIKNTEQQLRQLESVTPEEEDAVKQCLKEIEESLSRRRRK